MAIKSGGGGGHQILFGCWPLPLERRSFGKAPHLGKPQEGATQGHPAGHETGQLWGSKGWAVQSSTPRKQLRTVPGPELFLAGSAPSPQWPAHLPPREGSSFPAHPTAKYSAGQDICPHPHLSSCTQHCLCGCEASGVLSGCFTWAAARHQVVCRDTAVTQGQPELGVSGEEERTSRPRDRVYILPQTAEWRGSPGGTLWRTRQDWRGLPRVASRDLGWEEHPGDQPPVPPKEEQPGISPEKGPLGSTAGTARAQNPGFSTHPTTAAHPNDPPDLKHNLQG